MASDLDASYLSLRDAVLAYGAEKLPPPRYDLNARVARGTPDEGEAWSLFELKARWESEAAGALPRVDSLLQGENL
jgi:hypothetical protein